MIRKVSSQDIKAITGIYNEYILHDTATFETTPLQEATMRQRVQDIASTFPFWVYELDGEVVGYCYAHAWKERAAYRHTLETTVYLSSSHRGKGIGTCLMRKLIEACRLQGCHALIACITAENESSRKLHQKLGFEPVSHFRQVGFKFGRFLDIIDYELVLP